MSEASDELHRLLNAITTVDDLADFVAALRNDLATNPKEWENRTLDAYLESMENWVRSVPQIQKNLETYKINVGEPPLTVPSWQVMGHILDAPRVV